MIDFVLGVVFGGVSASGAYLLWHRFKATPVLPPAKQRHKTYGHPSAPVPALRERLPEAPMGHAWEVRVQHDNEGTPWLHLALLDLATATTVGETKKNLIRGGYPWTTWAGYYRNYGLHDYSSRKCFEMELLGPLVDWAVAQANRIANANSVGEYSLGEDS